ncbi:hypothetical protein BDW74DRAFT_189392 [Aspergillus multicolor]|uniref:ferric reductase family protein n=1 Tax=Aspergillus multicolor TaxID=41759 RepID=UPI003CCE3F34
MDIPKMYATAAGGILVATVLIKLIPPCVRWASVQVNNCLYYPYPYFIERHNFVGPWTWTSFVGHLLYLTSNLVALAYQTSSIAQFGVRAGKLSLANMIVLYAGSPLEFLGMSLRAYGRIHRAAAWMSGLLLTGHVIVAVTVQRETILPSESRYLFAIISAGCIAIVLLFSIPFLRSLLFEVFLLGHQGLAGLVLYAIWQHLPSGSLVGSRLYILIMSTVALAACFVRGALVIHYNGLFRSRQTEVQLSRPIGLPEDFFRGEVQQSLSIPFTVRIKLPKPIRLSAGQYVYLWMPFIGFWSWTQSHPYMVISWSQGEQDILDLYIHPQRGFSGRLLERSNVPPGTTLSLTGLISGPRGITEAISSYERVVAIATGSGVAAVIPYLQMLVFGCNTLSLHTRRIHFVLWISLFVQDANIQTSTQFGKHKRAMVHPCPPRYEEILCRDLLSDLDLNGDVKPSLNLECIAKNCAVASATGSTRDRVRAFIRQNRKENIKISELEYQP